MILWRISRHTSLDGEGGLRCSARWHLRGNRVIYTAENPATALLEILVHAEIDAEDVPTELTYLEIHAPDSASLEQLEIATLPPNWAQRPDLTQALGTNWLRSEKSLLLKVPCVIVPETFNLLINAAHPEIQSLKIARVHRHIRDARILKPAPLV